MAMAGADHFHRQAADSESCPFGAAPAGQKEHCSRSHSRRTNQFRHVLLSFLYRRGPTPSPAGERSSCSVDSRDLPSRNKTGCCMHSKPGSERDRYLFVPCPSRSAAHRKRLSSVLSSRNRLGRRRCDCPALIPQKEIQRKGFLFRTLARCPKARSGRGSSA